MLFLMSLSMLMSTQVYVSITYDSGVVYGKKYGVCPGANNLEILIVSASFRLTDLIGWHKLHDNTCDT